MIDAKDYEDIDEAVANDIMSRVNNAPFPHSLTR